MITDSQIGQRIRALLEAATAALTPEDYAARIAYCQEHNRPHTTMHLNPDDDLIEFRWGGRRLAMVHRATLDNDRPMRFGLVNDQPTPDTVPDDWAADA